MVLVNKVQVCFWLLIKGNSWQKEPFSYSSPNLDIDVMLELQPPYCHHEDESSSDEEFNQTTSRLYIM